jgi:transcriptional regulator GlxA family with amidase domain
MDAEYLASLYPAIRVEPDVLYVDEGSILTSAGIAAGIDLCLHLVRRDYGPDVANAVARRLVAAPHRAGGQAQFIEHAQRPTPTPGIARACAWALAHLAEPLTVDSLAAAASMSRRTFTRTFRADTGGSPHQWLLRQRILLARRLLEQTADPVERVAASCGFGSALSLRQHFNRLVGCGPLSYRRSFRGAAGGEPS